MLPYLRHLAIAAACCTTACLGAAGGSAAPLAPGGHHVLFVGNSLTYVNNLPGTLVAIAESAGDTIRVSSEAGPNLALIDHLNGATNAVSRIAEGGWEFVVLQQGPTPAGICRDSLILWTKLFEPHIRKVGAKPALMMTWPIVGVGPPVDDVRISFQQAAQAVNGVFMPAGEAWRIALRADPALALYGSDGLHPSPLGTFLAALEIYERVTGHDARTLPAKAFTGSQLLSLSEATIRLLQSAAHEANTTYPASAASAATVLPTVSKGADHC